MSQSAVIFGCIFFAFIVFVTMRGGLKNYIQYIL